LYRILIEYAIEIINDRIPEFTWYTANQVAGRYRAHVLIVEILADIKFSFVQAMCDDPTGSVKKLVSFLGERPSKDQFLEAVNYPCRRTH
jgi:hypothetical protein